MCHTVSQCDTMTHKKFKNAKFANQSTFSLRTKADAEGLGTATPPTLLKFSTTRPPMTHLMVKDS
jgi:hypothetical protein